MLKVQMKMTLTMEDDPNIGRWLWQWKTNPKIVLPKNTRIIKDIIGNGRQPERRKTTYSLKDTQKQQNIIHWDSFVQILYLFLDFGYYYA